MPDPTATVVEQHPSVVVVRVRADRLDETNLAAVRAEVSAAGLESPHLPVVLDMSNVAFLPSLSLGGLVQLAQIFKARGQRLVLTSLQTPVRQTITITRLDRLFEIQDDLSALLG
jgi:anti-anti-sigma factor